MWKFMPILSLSFLLGAGFLPDANTQQIGVEPNSLDIRVVAESVPEFNIESNCRVDNMSSSLDVGLDESIVRCKRDEQRARDQLQSRWSQFAGDDRVICIGETYDASGMPPSYVALSTCLGVFAKQLKN
jgi:hypothetical protein